MSELSRKELELKQDQELKERAAQFYAERYNLTRWSFRKVTELDTPMGTDGIHTGPMGPLEDGIYVRQPNPSFFTIIHKDGNVQFGFDYEKAAKAGNSTFGFQYKTLSNAQRLEMYGAAMDLLASHGVTVMKIDAATPEVLKLMLEAAAERGLAVEFGETTLKTLGALSPEAQASFYKVKADLDKNQSKMGLVLTAGRNKEFALYEEEIRKDQLFDDTKHIDHLPDGKTLEEAQREAFEQLSTDEQDRFFENKIDQEINNALSDPSESAKLTSLEKLVTATESAMEKIQHGRENLSQGIDSAKKLTDDPAMDDKPLAFSPEAEEAVKTHIYGGPNASPHGQSTARHGRSLGERIAERAREPKKKGKNRFENLPKHMQDKLRDPGQLLDALGKNYEAGKTNREALFKRLEISHREKTIYLEKLKKQLEELKTKTDPKNDKGEALSPKEKKAYDAQMTKLETKVKTLTERLTEEKKALQTSRTNDKDLTNGMEARAAKTKQLAEKADTTPKLKT